MKAAIIVEPGKAPIYGHFNDPLPAPDEVLITVSAAALSNVVKSRASGKHYSSSGNLPFVVGIDGVGRLPDGRRVYFVLPKPPFGSMSEQTVVALSHCIPLPDGLDDMTAAAIANPGMSAWGALVERAHLVAGETVLINGATGTAGRIAIQLAKYLGAAKVIATGRNVEELEEVKQLGADVVIPFTLGTSHPSGAKDYEEALKQVFASGINLVVDYLWGESAKTIIVALAKTVEDKPVRFVHVGGASREEDIELPGAALRSSAIMLMGSGVGSVSRLALVQSIRSVFEAVQPAGLKIATTVVPLSKVEDVWEKATGKPRVVFTVGNHS